MEASHPVHLTLSSLAKGRLHTAAAGASSFKVSSAAGTRSSKNIAMLSALLRVHMRLRDVAQLNSL